jgi:hypothetical protein
MSSSGERRYLDRCSSNTAASKRLPKISQVISGPYRAAHASTWVKGLAAKQNDCNQQADGEIGEEDGRTHDRYAFLERRIAASEEKHQQELRELQALRRELKLLAGPPGSELSGGCRLDVVPRSEPFHVNEDYMYERLPFCQKIFVAGANMGTTPHAQAATAELVPVTASSPAALVKIGGFL